MEHQDNQSGFKRKVYKKLSHSPLRASLELSLPDSKEKKIVPSPTIQGLREEFKRTFLPLLIDVFELRHLAESISSDVDAKILRNSNSLSAKEILEKLTTMQENVSEAKRWCEGLILQISKGIEEAKAALNHETRPSEHKTDPDDATMA